MRVVASLRQREAIDLFVEHQPDITLMDLAGRDGRHHGPSNHPPPRADARIVVLTGYGEATKTFIGRSRLVHRPT